jgi:hypothetical protein
MYGGAMGDEGRGWALALVVALTLAACGSELRGGGSDDEGIVGEEDGVAEIDGGVDDGDAVYEGMIVGENSRLDDMDVNVGKEKKLTNMRTTATDDNVMLEPPRQITLEYALEYIEDDELIEVTPENIRLRKRVLQQTERRKVARAAARIAGAS